MRSRACWVLLILVYGAFTGLAQIGSAQPIYTYGLATGSQLIDECPVCDRVPIPVPMSGTFRLQATEITPLFARYAISDLLFEAGGASGPHYRLTGGGTYLFPGEPALGQEMFLSLQVDAGSGQTLSYFTNMVDTVTATWPALEINLDQTNWTATKFYHLKLLAAPLLQFRSVTPDWRTGNVRLDWVSNGQQVQVERATRVDGPYDLLSGPTADQSFEDLGALTNQVQLFYRLRQQ